MDVEYLRAASSPQKYDMATAAITIGQTSAVVPNPHIQTNSICSIYRLPTESLEAIFLCCARDYYYNHPTPTVPSWANVSYVSRRWRSVALNCPALWSYLFIMSPRWTEVLLARSKQVSLKVHVNVRYQDYKLLGPQFVEQVMNHSERIQELCLDLGFFNHLLLSKLCSHAPCLQVLKIMLEGYPGQWSPESILFDGNTPALRTLELTACPVPWYSLKLSGLTTLSLTDIPDRFRQVTAEFLVTLRCMPDLTHLHLQGALTSATSFLSSAAFHCFQKIELPHLSHLFICAPLSTVIAFLSCVNVPLKAAVGCKLDEKFGDDPTSFNDFVPLCSLLARRFAMYEDQALSSSMVHSLVIACSVSGHVDVIVSKLHCDCVALLLGGRIELCCNIPLWIKFHFDPSTTRSEQNQVLSHICCSLPSSNVQNIHVLNPPFSPAFWIDILKHLRDVRRIKLSEGYMPALAPVLRLTSSDHTENVPGYADRGPILAPALEELELYDIVFEPTASERDMGPPELIDVQSLCDSLSTRTERRGRLTMAECNVYDEETTFDMAGWWEDGRFHVVDKQSH